MGRAEEIGKGGEDVSELARLGEMGQARTTLADAGSAQPIGQLTKFKSGVQCAEALVERLRDLEEGRGSGMKCGWRLIDVDLNRSLGGGVVPGLGIIAGRPGSGKSSFMVQLAGGCLGQRTLRYSPWR